MSQSQRPHAAGCSPAPSSSIFQTTCWDTVLAAGASRQALEKLCQTYWYPIYAYARRQGYTEHDAQDLTQGFFHQLLAKESFRQVQADRGRFRAFLISSFRHFLRDQWNHANALKRGGSRSIVSLELLTWIDAGKAEHRYSREPAEDVSADLIYERRWALTVLEEAGRRLRSEYAASGKAELWRHLQLTLENQPDRLTYLQVASQLGLSESAVKSAASRWRQRYRELVREEIGRTVSGPAEVDEEIQHLMRVLSG